MIDTGITKQFDKAKVTVFIKILFVDKITGRYMFFSLNLHVSKLSFFGRADTMVSNVAQHSRASIDSSLHTQRGLCCNLKLLGDLSTQCLT